MGLTRLVVLLGLFIVAVSASAGDHNVVFMKCVEDLQWQLCAQREPHRSLLDRLTSWTCSDGCRYECMHALTDRHLNGGAQILQYYGKWPFWRALGMQEPASVVFSLLNFWVHASGARRLRKSVPDGHPMKKYYIRWAFLSMNAWIWSAVFHTRDVRTTEKLDYFFAALSILSALHTVVIRIFHLYPRARNQLVLPSLPSVTPRKTLIAWTGICIAIYVSHVAYLSVLPRFDYNYNMIFNLVIGLLHNALWIAYALPSTPRFSIKRFPNRPKTYRPKYADKAAWFVVLTMAATCLELFDFPPWGRIIDAHSLWHLATIPIASYWYDFLIQDSLDDGWKQARD